MDAKTSRIERKFDTKWAQIGHDRDQGQSLPSPLIVLAGQASRHRRYNPRRQPQERGNHRRQRTQGEVKKDEIELTSDSKGGIKPDAGMIYDAGSADDTANRPGLHVVLHERILIEAYGDCFSTSVCRHERGRGAHTVGPSIVGESTRSQSKMSHPRSQ